MRRIAATDRLTVRLIYWTGMWALDTPFEALATTTRRVQPARDEEITPESIDALESHVRMVASGIGRWIVAGILLTAIGGLVSVADSPAANFGFALVWLILTPCWVTWIVCCLVQWRKWPEWSFADRVAVALKRHALRPDTLELLRSHDSAELLRLALGSVLSGSTGSDTSPT